MLMLAQTIYQPQRKQLPISQCVFYTSKLVTNGISPLEKIFIDSYTSHDPTMHENKSFVSVCNSFLLVAFPSVIN